MFRKIWHWGKRTIKEFHPDIVAAYAAGASLFIIISFFPFMIMLLSLLRYLPIAQLDMEHIAFDFSPNTIKDLLISVVQEIAQNTSAVVFPLAALTGLWSASTGFVALSKGLNLVYNREETRSFLVVRVMCLVYTVILLLILIAVLVLLVFGRVLLEWMGSVFPLLSLDALPIVNLRSIVTVLVLTLFFTLLYKTVPNRKTRWFAEIPGALLSALAWMLFSLLYSLYISKMGEYSTLYGSLTAVVLLMFWLYCCIYILFAGARINVLLQQSYISHLLLKEYEREQNE